MNSFSKIFSDFEIDISRIQQIINILVVYLNNDNCL